MIDDPRPGVIFILLCGAALVVASSVLSAILQSPTTYLLHAHADCEAALMAEPRLPYNVSLNVQNLCDGLATVVESMR